jgi:hypothetical protein
MKHQHQLHHQQLHQALPSTASERQHHKQLYQISASSSGINCIKHGLMLEASTA